MNAKIKLLTAIMILSVSVLLPTGNIPAAAAEAMNPNNQIQSFNHQRQVVNIEQSARKVIPNYIRWYHNGLHPSVRVDIREVKLINVEEQGVVPGTEVQMELVQRGPEKVVQTLQHDAFNPSSDKELTVSHNFTHTVSNASTLTKSITHSHKAGAKATFKVSTKLFGNGTDIGGELSYEYTNSNQSGTSDAKTVTFSTNSSASAKLPPMSKGTLISQVYASPATYKIKSLSYFTGDVEFSYNLSTDDWRTVRTLKVPLNDLFFRGDENNEVAVNDHLWARSVWDDATGRQTKALFFEGLSFLTLDEQYRTETYLKDI